MPIFNDEVKNQKLWRLRFFESPNRRHSLQVISFNSYIEVKATQYYKKNALNENIRKIFMFLFLKFLFFTKSHKLICFKECVIYMKSMKIINEVRKTLLLNVQCLCSRNVCSLLSNNQSLSLFSKNV